MGKSSWKWNEFNKVHNNNDLEGYLYNREFEHSNYYHYTTAKAVDSILSGNSFWVSNVSGFNDTIDKKQFGNEEKFCFSLCFSTGTSENLPLWYLYSGINGKGARISISKSSIQCLVQESTFKLCEFNDNKTIASSFAPITLDREKDLVCTFRDVLYYNQVVEGKTRLKYNTMTNNDFPDSEFNKYKERHSGFCKSLIWFYEKETRLVLRLNSEIRKKIDSTKKYVIVMKFNEAVRKKMKITFAPNVTKSDMENIEKEYTNISNFLHASSKVALSDYSGTVNFNICGNCEHRTSNASKEN